MAYLVFYPAHLTFIPIAYADSGSRRRRRYYEYANPRMFRRLDRLFRELYGIQR